MSVDQAARSARTPLLAGRLVDRSWLPHAGAFSAYLALGFVVMWRFVGDPAGQVSSHLPEDHTWFQWLLAHGAHVVAYGENPLFSTAQNTPHGVNMMANTSVLGVTVPLAPLTLLAGPRVAYVVWIVLASSGTAATAYWVLQRDVVQSRGAAFVGGALAGFAPGVIHHANGQPNFVSNFALPLIVAAVFRLGRGRWLRGGVMLGLLVTWQVFLNEELLLITALACGVGTLGYAIFNPRAAKQRAARFGQALGVTAVTAGVLCAYPIWFQFHRPRSFVGMPAYTSWGEDPTTYLIFARDTLAGGPEAELVQGLTEQNSWFGWPLTSLLLALIVLLWRFSVTARVAAVVAVVFATLSIGPVLRFGGELTGREGPLALLPAEWPLVNLLVPSRLTYAVTGAAVVLVALVWDRWRLSRVLVTAALIPLLPTPLPAMPERPAPAFITSGVWRQFVRPGGVLVPVPLPSRCLGRDTLGWSAEARQEFSVPEGYFLGPGPDGRGKAGPTYDSRTTQLVNDAHWSGRTPELTSEDHQAVRADVTGWRGEALAMRAEPGNTALRDLISQVYGQPLPVADVWLWRP